MSYNPKKEVKKEKSAQALAKSTRISSGEGRKKSGSAATLGERGTQAVGEKPIAANNRRIRAEAQKEKEKRSEEDKAAPVRGRVERGELIVPSRKKGLPHDKRKNPFSRGKWT